MAPSEKVGVDLLITSNFVGLILFIILHKNNPKQEVTMVKRINYTILLIALVISAIFISALEA